MSTKVLLAPCVEFDAPSPDYVPMVCRHVVSAQTREALNAGYRDHVTTHRRPLTSMPVTVIEKTIYRKGEAIPR